MRVDLLLKWYEKFPEFPHAEWEFEPYRKYPFLVKELAVRAVTDEGEKWIRHLPLPVDAQKFSGQAVEIIERLAGKGLRGIEFHVSTCLYEDMGDRRTAVQHELFFDFDAKDPDRMYAFAHSLSQAMLIYQTAKGRGMYAYSGNRSVHAVIRPSDVGFESFSDEYVEALAKALKHTAFVRGRRSYKLDLLDYQALATKCHLRRMLYSPNIKSGLVEFPIDPSVASYSRVRKEIEEFAKRVFSVR